MSQKLCLQWNDFKENVNIAFGSLRDTKDFSDVTLACADGQQVEAHKVILAASSPFFQNLLKQIKHPHPVIFLRGFQSHDLVAVVDFLYLGEANVFQENLNSFLAIAEELKLKGLTDQDPEDILSTQDNKSALENKEKANHPLPVPMTTTCEEPSRKGLMFKSQVNAVRTAAVPSQFPIGLLTHGEKMKSMIMKSPNMIQLKGKSRTRKSYDLQNVPIPCNFCDNVFDTRTDLAQHKLRNHNNLIM